MEIKYVQQIYDNVNTNIIWFISKCNNTEWEEDVYDFEINIEPEYIWEFLKIFDYPTIVYPNEQIIRIYDDYIE